MHSRKPKRDSKKTIALKQDCGGGDVGVAETLMSFHLPSPLAFPLPPSPPLQLRRRRRRRRRRRMRQLYTRNGSLKRLLSTIRIRSKEQECREDAYAAPAPVPEVLDKKPPAKPSWRCFSYKEIHKATDGFHKDNLVGVSGHAEVYRDVTVDGQVIAMKRLMRASLDEQREKDFLTELDTVGHVHHPNDAAAPSTTTAAE